MLSLIPQNWFLWPLTLAIFLELFGLAVHAYYMCHPTERDAYLLAFVPTLVAPVLVSMANYSIFHRLITWTITASNRASHPVWQLVHSLASLFPVVGATPIFLYAMGFSDLCRYVSSAPIKNANEALSRILFNERGQRMIFNGHVAGLACLGVFTFLAVVSFAAAPRLHMSGDDDDNNTSTSKNAKCLFWAISSVNALCLVSMVFKVVHFLVLQDKMAGCSRIFWVTDHLPIVAAMLVLCFMHPAQYLPEQFAGVMYDYSDDFPSDQKVLV